MQDANADRGIDLSQFRRWYSQAGTPRVQAQGQYDAATGTYTLSLSQTCPPVGVELQQQTVKQPFHIPLRVALLSGEGAAFIATSSDSNIMTKLILSPPPVMDDRNPQNEGQNFYFSTSVGNWVRDTEPTISAGAVPVPPSRYLYLQNTGTGSFAIDAYFAGTLLNMNNISASNGTSSNTSKADAAGSTTSNSITSAKTIDEVKVIVSSKIQTALSQGAPAAQSTSDVAALLGVSKSNLSKAMKLARDILPAWFEKK